MGAGAVISYPVQKERSLNPGACPMPEKLTQSYNNLCNIAVYVNVNSNRAFAGLKVCRLDFENI
jgi:hypothetical protein